MDILGVRHGQSDRPDLTGIASLAQNRGFSQIRITGYPWIRRVHPISMILTDDERSYRFDVRQFHRMMAAAIFNDQNIGLVAGQIYAMTDFPPPIFAVGRLHEALRALLSRDEWTIWEEKPMLIGCCWAPPSRIIPLDQRATRPQ